MRRSYLKILISISCVIFCSSCAMTAKYQRPVVQAPPAFAELAGSDQWKTATPGDGLLKGKWWEIFGDPQLNSLEEKVNINNYTIKQLEAQFRQSVDIIDINRTAYYPTVSSSPSINQSDRG